MVDDEALGSVLISWYMSGYHTGYYLVCAQRLVLQLLFTDSALCSKHIDAFVGACLTGAILILKELY